MVLEAERGAELADAMADDPHADLPVGDRTPGLPGAIGRLDTPGPQDLRAGLLGFGRYQQAIAPRPSVPRNDRLESGLFITGASVVAGGAGRGDCRTPPPGAL
jgi:hypothetical protein